MSWPQKQLFARTVGWRQICGTICATMSHSDAGSLAKPTHTHTHTKATMHAFACLSPYTTFLTVGCKSHVAHPTRRYATALALCTCECVCVSFVQFTAINALGGVHFKCLYPVTISGEFNKRKLQAETHTHTPTQLHASYAHTFMNDELVKPLFEQ